MSRAQIQCPGCNRAFSHSGFSQHISRSQRSSCRVSGSNLASNATSWDHSTGSSNKSGLERSTTQDGEVSKLCRRSLANLWTTERVNLANNAYTPPSEVAEAAEPTDFAAAASPPDCEDITGTVDHEDAADPADMIDADLLETLSRNFNCSATNGPEHSTTPNEPPLVGSPSLDPPPPIHFEHGVSDGASQMIVDGFPHNSAGAPIPSAREGSHIYQSTQEAFGTSIWAPFRSQCDWEIARWAKMRGPSSSAVADLFAIPGVRA
jgi:hypothetical protein